MPRIRLFTLVLCLFLMTGCGKGTEPVQQALDFRTQLLEKGTCSFTAHIRADFGAQFYDFTLAAECAEEEASLSVIAPEEIAGITASVTKEGAVLEFDGTELAFGTLANGNISPVTVPWLLEQSWKSAYISCAGADGALYRVTYLRGYADGQITVDTWFDEGGIPVRGEMLYDGRRCITVTIEDFMA